MSKKKLTPWFPGNVNPTRVGIYERKWKLLGQHYALWDGFGWSLSFEGIDNPLLLRAKRSDAAAKNLPWRGLAHPPKGAK
jgi:hypothetical protein